jgi:hypothetical protein
MVVRGRGELRTSPGLMELNSCGALCLGGSVAVGAALWRQKPGSSQRALQGAPFPVPLDLPQASDVTQRIVASSWLVLMTLWPIEAS